MSDPLQLQPAVARGNFHEGLWVDPNWTAEEKLDGVRYLWHHHGDHFHLTSRRTSSKTGHFVEKSGNFPQLLPLLNVCGEGTILDGEIVVPANKSYGTIAISGSSPSRALWLQEEFGWATYVVFDVPSHNGPMSIRKDYLVDILNGGKVDYVELVKSQYEWQSSTRESFLYSIWAQGGEGVILKDLNAYYGDSRAWVKVKAVLTFDVVVTGFQDASETSIKVGGQLSATKFAEKGWIGALCFGQYVEGKLVTLGTVSGFDDATREEISLNKSTYIGSVMELKAQERLPSGSLRHPRFVRFRDDKNPEDCVMEV